MKVQLGTAQFGNVYGLTNSRSPLSKEECWSILDAALDYGVCEVDTSPDYGHSLSILSEYVGGPLTITSKVRVKGLSKHEILRNITRQWHEVGSFHNLSTVLVHDFSSLNPIEVETILSIQEDELPCRLGFSIYDDWELAVLAKRSKCIPIQIPISILNQTLLKKLENCKKNGFEFIARSIFLQGVLDWSNQKNTFKEHPDVLKVRNLGVSLNLNPIELAINFAKQLDVSSILVGFASQYQLKEFIDIWRDPSIEQIDFSEYGSEDLSLIDPRLW
jgi:aryl-alcohol dehydrogenase-like predicted oxidoreductase